MVGLRAEKKQQNQISIVKEATKSFFEKGYQQSTMAEIAKNAKVGTGTIYNYYPSKGKLLLAVFEDEFVRLQNDKGTEIELDDGNLVQQITRITEIFMSFLEDFPKSFWREIIHVMTEDAEESEGIRQGLFGLDDEMMTIVKGTIEKHEDSFKTQFDSTQGTRAIYNILMMQFMIFIYDDQMTYHQLLTLIKQQITFLFVGKLKEEMEE
ncbi:TetR/AcrR family transcriptional regulator [Aquibacillus halophilus]|nr:TetR/AcrR family transcriptional regulator [Aquibacillus halophilus]